jgi:glycosyltransferase involved in cell wall biosynthesis
MRILHIDTGREMRGGQWQAFYLIQGLAERRIESVLLAPGESALFQTARKARIPVRPLNLLGPFRAGAGFDLLHAHDARAHTLGLFSTKPLIVSRRVAFPVQQGLLSRYKYRKASHFIAVSDYVRRMLIDAGVDDAKITVVYDGVSVAEGPRFEPAHVVALDTDDPQKGKTVIEEASKLSGIPVHFSKYLPRDLLGCALFVYITESEGLGSAALLAMAHGVPVLASDTGGLPEIVQDGRTGVLVSNTPEAVASAMQRLLNDRRLASSMGACGRSQVERNFTLNHMVENTIRVYEKVLG